MDAAAVAAWFADALNLPQYAAAVKAHGVDGDVLLELEKWDNLSELEITNLMDQAKVRGGLAKLGRKRAAEGPAGGTAVARAKRPRLAGAEAEVTPGPAAAASATAVEGGMEQAAFQQAAAQLELAASAPPARRARSPACGSIFTTSAPAIASKNAA